jgi:P27 family predicted phage terminase small subunit
MRQTPHWSIFHDREMKRFDQNAIFSNFTTRSRHHMSVGRKPKPNALKELEGNPGKRTLNKQEPKFGGVAKCPTHLNKTAKAEWKRVSKELADSGLLTSVDRAALAGYCVAWARWVDAELHLEKDGVIIAGAMGGTVRNPWLIVATQSLDLVRKFAVEFGMTPSSRARIHVETPTKPSDPFADFMAGLGASESETDAATTDLCTPSN